MLIKRPFMNANEAKLATNNAIRPQQRAQTGTLKDMLDEAIRGAIEKGMVQVTIPVHPEMDPITVSAMERTLKRMGYRARVDVHTGHFNGTDADKSVFILPKVTMTVGW